MSKCGVEPGDLSLLPVGLVRAGTFQLLNNVSQPFYSPKLESKVSLLPSAPKVRLAGGRACVV